VEKNEYSPNRKAILGIVVVLVNFRICDKRKYCANSRKGFSGKYTQKSPDFEGKKKLKVTRFR
jgi:hypothetical protein